MLPSKHQKTTIRQPVARIGSNNDSKKKSLRDIISRGADETPIQPPNLEIDDDMINPMSGAFAALSRGNSTISQNQVVTCPGNKKHSYKKPVLKTNISDLLATNPNKMMRFGSLIQKKAVDNNKNQYDMSSITNGFEADPCDGYTVFEVPPINTRQMSKNSGSSFGINKMPSYNKNISTVPPLKHTAFG